MAEPAITEAEIEAAERLMGIAYTARERAQMVGNLAGQIGSAVDRRSVSLANTVPMSLRFDPRLPGCEMPTAGGVVASTSRAALPDADADIAFATLPSLRLTELYLERIERLGPVLECFVTVTPDLARAEAAAADQLFAAGVWLGRCTACPMDSRTCSTRRASPRPGAPPPIATAWPVKMTQGS
jgi:hypothetical protein